MDLITGIGQVLFPAFFFAILSLARFCINLGFVERPLFVGFIWGLVSGDIKTAVSLAIFYELFWLDLFPAGTYIPPNALFPMLSMAALAGFWGDTDITVLFVPIILTLPLASLGASLERRHRELQASGYERLLQHFQTGRSLEDAARLSIGASLAQIFCLNFSTFFCATSLILFIAGWIAPISEPPFFFTQASWPLLWAFGGIGSVLALRIRRGFIAFAAACFCLVLLVMFGVRW